MQKSERNLRRCIAAGAVLASTLFGGCRATTAPLPGSVPGPDAPPIPPIVQKAPGDKSKPIPLVPPIAQAIPTAAPREEKLLRLTATASATVPELKTGGSTTQYGTLFCHLQSLQPDCAVLFDHQKGVYEDSVAGILPDIYASSLQFCVPAQRGLFNGSVARAEISLLRNGGFYQNVVADMKTAKLYREATLIAEGRTAVDIYCQRRYGDGTLGSFESSLIDFEADMHGTDALGPTGMRPKSRAHLRPNQ